MELDGNSYFQLGMRPKSVSRERPNIFKSQKIVLHLFVIFFDLWFNAPVNSCGHAKMVS